MADEEVSHQRIQPNNFDNVSVLLSTWGLSDLIPKFKSHEIEIRSLFCLTEKDICELIPKIGRRAIFRTNLLEWRNRNKIHNTQKRRITRSPSPPQFVPPSSTRSQTPTIVEESSRTIPPICETVIKSEQQHSDYESEEISDNLQNQNNNDTNDNDNADNAEEFETEDEESLERPLSAGDVKNFTMIMPSKRSRINCHIDVKEILTSLSEGRQIINYYKAHNTLDYSHRRKLVSVLINDVVCKNKWLIQDDFARISNDIIKMFPREDVATYYTARNGLKNPKGCLYNKFLNLTRKLRQEGVLQYRNNIQLTPERISSRHIGEIKRYHY